MTVGTQSVGRPTFADDLRAFITLLDRCHPLADRLEEAIRVLGRAVYEGRPILICGNGGSASEAEHMTAELVGRFLIKREPINAICLNSNSAMMTAWANDVAYKTIFERQVQAHGSPGAALVCFSTSGDSINVVKAARMAHIHGMPVISLTGEGGGRLANETDVLLSVPSRSTPMIQQVHQLLMHHICGALEASLSEVI
jgi:D-sedoheptulose 7-phosphate isomerase